MTLAPGTRLGPYEVTAKLGEGGMGEVYRATDTTLKRDVAIKVLPAAFTEDRERLARFEREAQLLAQLNHPNIAQIHALEKWGQLPISAAASHAPQGSEKSETVPIFALVMELVEGPTLAERLEQGPLPFNESLSVSLQIAQALEEAHEKGIVHRDLKPQNIKASREGKVKVLDFGLAKAMDPAAGSAASAADLARSPTLMQSPTLTAAHGTQLGVILGTAAYMAPEQARGGAVDRRADIWAFGVVLYEMLCGRSLFVADTVSDTLAGVLRAEIDFGALPASTPPAIRRLLRRCLERNPKNRLRDIGEARIALSGDLEEAPRGGDASVAAGGAAGVPSRKSRLLRWLPWATAAVLAIVAALSMVRAGRSPAPLGVRAVIDLPVELTLDRVDHSVALSPDGRLLVLAAADETGVQNLYLRALDKLEVRQLAGTQSASYPFWSPDGRAIGFFAERKLRRLDLPDGPVRTLCDAAAGRGATWGANDTIVFAPAAVGGLQEVAAAGGAPRPFGPEAPEGVSYRLPRFLPDGDGLVYYALGERAGAPDGAYIVDASGGAGRLLLEGPREVQPIAPGLVAFERQGLLMIQPFDRRQRELTGTASPIGDGVQFSADRMTSNFSFSAQGPLVYQLAPPVPIHRFEWLDRSGATIGSIGEQAGILDVHPSPDGKRAVIDSFEGSQRGQLWMLDLVRGVRSPFSSPGERLLSPVWSPDGGEVAYYDYSTGVNRLVVRPADGAASPRVLHEQPELEYTPFDWSPDGTKLLYGVLSNRDKQMDLALLDVDGKSAPRTVIASPALESGASFSPDGKWIAFLSDESGRLEIYLVAYPALGRKWPVTSGGSSSSPDWISPTELAHAETDGKLVSIQLRFGEGSVDAGAPRPLFGDRRLEGSVDFVPALNRFLSVTPVSSARPSAPLVLVTDWRAELQR